MSADLSKDAVIAATRVWLVADVIGLNLCPFAKAVHDAGQIRYVVSEAESVEDLRTDLVAELRLLTTVDAGQVDTTLLIHPRVLGDFADYNQFLDVADEALRELDLVGTLQIASFHPQYQFAGTRPEDAENRTNRSPYPTLHLLREASVERAIESYPGASEIPQRNIEEMRRRSRQP